MSDETIYYQWQNPALLKTIYPRREAKLRHALEFYYEIDLWAEYKNKKLEELSKEIEEYHADKKRSVQQSWERYDHLLNHYFIINVDDSDLPKKVLDEIKIDLPKKILKKINNDPPVDVLNEIKVNKDLSAKILNKISQMYKDFIENEILCRINVVNTSNGKENVPTYNSVPVDKQKLARVKVLHNSFQSTFKNYNDTHKESVFISSRLKELDEDLKILKQDIYAQSMRLYAMKTYYLDSAPIAKDSEDNDPEDNDPELMMLHTTQKLVEVERSLLSELLIEHGKLEDRKKEWESAPIKSEKSFAKLKPVKDQVSQQERTLKEIQIYLNHLRTQPDRVSLEKYFCASPDRDAINAYFSKDNLKGLILDLVFDRFQKSESRSVDMQVEFQKYVDMIMGFHKEIPAILKSPAKDKVKLAKLNPVFERCVSNLKDFTVKMERNAPGYETRFKEVCLKIAEMELDRLNALKAVLDRSVRDENGLKTLIKVKAGEKSRTQKNYLTLREEANKWQSQIDMLAPILEVTDEVYRREYIPLNLTEEAWRKEIVLWKAEKYKASLLELEKAGQDPSQAQYRLLEMLIERFNKEPNRYPLWLQYMIIHFSGMRYKSAHGTWADPKDLYLRLKESKIARVKQDLAELDLDSVDVETMTEAQVLEELKRIVDVLPANVSKWMWKEVCSVTRLRLREAREPESSDDGTWEKFSPAEQSERNSPESANYRGIINEWKNAWFTNWREAHWHNKQMVVSRAVCNEVAEYIQHLRGHRGGAGLSSKPDWYRGEEDNYKSYQDSGMMLPKGQEPVFLFPRRLEDYRVGASILWLRYRKDPAHPWDKAEPFTTSGGDELVPTEYLKRKDSEGVWTYKDNGLTRSRTMKNEKGLAVKSNQYIFWLHEQTVAGVFDTAEGRVLLTFETALPYDDPSVSAIGLTKHYESDVFANYGEDGFNRYFVGFVPEGISFNGNGKLVVNGIPVDDLKLIEKGETARNLKLIVNGHSVHDLKLAANGEPVDDLKVTATKEPADDLKVILNGKPVEGLNVVVNGNPVGDLKLTLNGEPVEYLKVIGNGLPLDDLKEMLNWNHILRNPGFMMEDKLKEYQEKYIRSNLPTPIKAQSVISDGKTTITFTVMPPPDSTQGSKFFVKIWGTEMGRLADRDASTKPPFPNGEPFSNFQAIPLFTEKMPFEAVSQYIDLDQDAIEYLKSLQPRDEPKAGKSKPNKESPKKSKFDMAMDWLVRADKGRPYWTVDGGWDDGKWSAFRFGTIVFGGQMVQVEVNERDEPVVYKFKARYPSEEKNSADPFWDNYKVSLGGNDKDGIEFYKLIGLLRTDMYKVSHETHPWLIQQCTSVSGDNVYNRTPRGLTIYHPVWDPRDWKLSSGGTSLYIARHFLQDTDPAIEFDLLASQKNKKKGKG